MEGKFMNDEMKQARERSDIRGTGLQCRLRREALGLTRRDMAALLGVEESTVYRWESGIPPKRLDLMLVGFEHEVEAIKAKLDERIREFGRPFDTIKHNDLHIAVPRPGVQVGKVWVFGEEERVLDHAPASLLRALAGRLIASVNAEYLVFAREVEDAGTLDFARATQSISAK
jgi:transcriptional regulator with XRE-family HTH domain